MIVTVASTAFLVGVQLLAAGITETMIAAAQDQTGNQPYMAPISRLAPLALGTRQL